MALALNVLVSTMSGAGFQVLFVDLLDGPGLGQAQDVVAPLERLRVLGESGAAELGLAEGEGLNARSHGPVEQQDPVRQEIFQRLCRHAPSHPFPLLGRAGSGVT